MTREQLLKSKEYWTLEIQNDLYELIEKYMADNNLNRTELATKLSVTKGYITQLLNGDFDHKVSKMVELALTINKAPIVHFVDLDRYIEDDNLNKNHVYKPSFHPVQLITITAPAQQTIITSPIYYEFKDYSEQKSMVSSK